MATNPVRNRAIEYILAGLGLGLDEQQIATIAGAVAGSATVPLQAAGDASGTENAAGEMAFTITGIHGQEQTTPTLAADEDDYEIPFGKESLVWRVDFDGFAITGFTAPEEVGEVHLVVALSAGTLAHDNAGSADANKLLITGGADLSMAAGDLAWMWYDGTANRWRVLGDRSGSGGLTPASYTITNPTTDRTFDADSITLDELADVVATLIADLGGT